MEINVVFLTGLVSIFTQYVAVILAAICIVDFFSYKTRKIMFITLPYLFLSPVIFSVASNFLFHPYSNGMLLHGSLLSYYNLATTSTIHLLLGLMIIGMYLRDILSKTKSLVIQLRRTRNKN